MPVSYRHLTGTNRISEEYGIINENFDDVAADINAINTDTGNLQQDVQAAQQTADTAVTKADAAQQTADTGVTNAAAAQTSADQAQETADQGVTAAGAAQAAADVAQQTANTVTSDLVNHEADNVRHFTTADRTKLADIQPEAEKNQNAFAKVNDLNAANPTDSLTIKAGPGIAVTTNPNSKEVEITATGTSTPGPHASSHLEHGSDPIPDATPTTGGLMSAADKTKLDKLKPPPWTWQDLEGGI